MKYLLLAALTINFFCTSKQDVDCVGALQGKDHFMLHGGILDKYDNGRVFIGIERINDPKNWDYNEYFTGYGFSKDKNTEMKVLEKDSCKLKKKYLIYLRGREGIEPSITR